MQFRIVFYKSENGQLALLKTLVRNAARLIDLVHEPPEEFFEMLKQHTPIHGWAEIEDEAATVFVIFAPRSETDGRPTRQVLFASDEDDEDLAFRAWLEHVKPSDFNPHG